MISNASISSDPANPSGNIIEVSVESVSGGSATLSGEMPKPTLTEYTFNKGSFQEMFPRTNQQKEISIFFRMSSSLFKPFLDLVVRILQ